MPATLLIPLYRDEVAPRFDLAGEVLLVTLDAALVLSLLGFLSTVALTRYLLVGRVMR